MIQQPVPESLIYADIRAVQYVVTWSQDASGVLLCCPHWVSLACDEAIAVLYGRHKTAAAEARERPMFRAGIHSVVLQDVRNMLLEVAANLPMGSLPRPQKRYQRDMKGIREMIGEMSDRTQNHERVTNSPCDELEQGREVAVRLLKKGKRNPGEFYFFLGCFWHLIQRLENHRNLAAVFAKVFPHLPSAEALFLAQQLSRKLGIRFQKPARFPGDRYRG